MGLFERFRKTDDSAPEPPIDADARRAQLDELDEALRGLARELAADRERMANPGWAIRVEDLRRTAREATDLSAPGAELTRTAVLDLVNGVVGLPPTPDYAPYAAAAARVEQACAALRAVLPGETG